MTPAPQPKPERGIYCPSCHSRLCPVQHTRRQLSGRVLRYRKCVHCGRNFTTSEKLAGGE